MISGGTLKYKDQIEEQKNKAIVDAQNSYAKNMPTYGSTSAALNNMGLAGSGYSDYLAGKAYSAYRSDVQNANNAYNANMLTYQQNQANAYLDLLNEVENGGGSIDYLNAMSNMYGFDTSDLQKKVYRNELLNGLGTKTFNNAAEVQEYLNTYKDKLSEEDLNKIRDNEATSIIKANGFDTAGLDTEWANDINKNKINTAWAYEYDSLGNGDDIKVEIGGKKLTLESKGATYDEDVLSYANNVKDRDLFLKGDNVYIKNGDKVYKVGAKSNSVKNEEKFNDVRHYLLTGNERTDSERESAGVYNHQNSLKWADGKVFTYAGKQYFQKDGVIYRVDGGNNLTNMSTGEETTMNALYPQIYK